MRSKALFLVALFLAQVGGIPSFANIVSYSTSIEVAVLEDEGYKALLEEKNFLDQQISYYNDQILIYKEKAQRLQASADRMQFQNEFVTEARRRYALSAKYHKLTQQLELEKTKLVTERESIINKLRRYPKYNEVESTNIDNIDIEEPLH